MTMQGSHGVTGVWKGGWNEAGLSRWAESLRSQLPQSGVTLGLAFLAPSLFAYAEEVLEILRVHGRIPCLAGCSGVGLISGANEFEQGADLVLGLHHLPGATLKGFHFNTEEIEATEDAAAWVQKTGLTPKQVNGWLIFASPFDLNGETWLRQWNKAYPGIPAIGGLASGDFAAQQSQVYFNGEVHEHGLVAVALCGDVTLETVVSQGCTPIGQSWTITRADRNFILGIGNRPAYSVLMETFESLTLEERKKSQTTSSWDWPSTSTKRSCNAATSWFATCWEATPRMEHWLSARFPAPDKPSSSNGVTPRPPTRNCRPCWPAPGPIWADGRSMGAA